MACTSGTMNGLPVHICFGGPDRLLTVNGRAFLFEMHRYCGPILLNKRTGDPLKRQPGERSPFWDAFECWRKQGQRVDGSGHCIWEPAPKPKTVHLGGKHYLLVSDEDQSNAR